ncbi:MAG: hypothetical protein ACPGL0_05530 [Limisphaerales bacterium]
MIRLNPDCVVITCDQGDHLPCSVQTLTLQLLGEQAHWLDAEVFNDICGAVMAYLREEEGKATVPLHEFASVLEEVLVGFGLNLPSQGATDQLPRVEKTHVMEWMGEIQDAGLELILYQRLRAGLHRQIHSGRARILWVHGLRSCVKQHLGAQRWGRRCQQLHDQLISFIRQCFDQTAGPGYSLVLHP